MSTKSSSRAPKSVESAPVKLTKKEQRAEAKRIAEENEAKRIAEEAARVAELAKLEAAKNAAPAKALVVRDAFGNRLSTRAHAINSIILNADKALKTSEIETMAQTSELGRAYALANGRQIGAVRNHLQALLALKLVTLDKGAWRAVEDATKAQRLLQIAADAEAAAREAEKNAKS